MSEEKQIKKEVTIDDLALMVANGFNEVNERMDNGFKKVKNELGEEIKSSAEEVKSELRKEIKESTGEIKSELNKKVDKIEYNTLEYRVEKLEKKYA